MAKKDFTKGGGLDALFTKPTGKSSAPKQPTAQAEQTAPSGDGVGSLSGRGDILSSIQDAELRAALRAKRMDGRGRPRKGVSRESLTEGYSRATMLVNSEKYAKLRDIGLQETKTIKEVVEAAFDLAIKKYEETGSL